MASELWDLIRVIAAGLALWALICGVTVRGEHYGLRGCTSKGGVEIDMPARQP